MRLSPMRFKNFTWPHNPEVYSVSYQRRIAVHQTPFGHCVLQELGSAFRVFKGEGVFAGRDAYQKFQQLADVFRQDGPGLLVHPVWKIERAYFASLQLTEVPAPDFVRYKFEFWEDWNGFDSGLHEIPVQPETPAPSQNSGGQKNICVVRKGDTLWGIARRYGVELTELIHANPQIKNPNLIYPGNEVAIP